tara:strand:+ start:638 stop:1456 length:819 start_codon:yes stop_codon:yes gene_type:complete
MSNLLSEEIIDSVKDIACLAGDAIMDIYSTNFDFQLKDDNSPLTKADETSNKIILESLKETTPNIPVLSEESSNISFEERASWGTYWLVDPLDGTKEFIKKNGEFTVNIALIENNTPIFGVIRVPALSVTYWGGAGIGSMKEIDQNIVKNIHVSKFNSENIRVISSRSHKNKILNSYLKSLGFTEEIHVGSSLKFCLLAEGKADFYPRLGPTSEWDTAAGEAILKFSGGFMLSDEGIKMAYNVSESLLNPYFLASSNEKLIEKFIGYYNKPN